ncbi:MAG: hypothetical protein K6A68_07890 [Clostridiales bacterium]|nr:hypothetical protein [Clostridiales bacterium]
MFQLIEKFVRRLFWLPFALGLVGYGVAGVPFADSIYASAALYFVNPVNDASNLVILLAKLLALLVTTGFLLSILGNVWTRFKQFICNRFVDSACVYTDNAYGEQLADSMKHSYLCRDLSEKKDFRAHDHFFFYTDEQENLRGFAEHADKLEGKRVFIGVKQMDPSLLKDTARQDVHYFNILELMARSYWRKYPLYREVAEEGKAQQIAILNDNPEGEAVFRYGFMNNLYSLSQQITYHIWGCTPARKAFLSGLDTENGDRIVLHEGDWHDDPDILQTMDRVIVTEESPMKSIEELLYLDKNLTIHFFSETRAGYEEILDAPNLAEFGNLKDILTEDNIRRELLYRQAKLCNYDYLLRSENRTCPEAYEGEMETAWRKLDGFKKSSSIAQADHYWIKKRLKENGTDEETLWEMEHIRWCRFLKISHWKYAEKRDNSRRRHPLLVPYAELSEKEKAKDGIYDAKIRQEMDRLA